MVNELEFRWIPGHGPRHSAVDSLRRNFGTRPSTAPGEAWFMSKERRFFTEFLGQPMTDVPLEVIQEFLFEATSGLGSFPDCVDDVEDWISWFHYMLVFLVERGQERHVEFLIEGAITAFIRINGDSPEQRYSGFREDALMTLGQALMKPEFWNEQGDCIAAYQDGWVNRLGELKRNVSCDGAISSSLFFCLLYLPAGKVSLWTQSVLQIKSIYFRAHFLVWLVSLFQILQGPTSLWLRSVEKAPYDIEWANSFLLEDTNPKIPNESLKQFLDTVRAELSKERLSEWSTEISTNGGLAEMMKRFSIFDQVSSDVSAATQ
jgi:hypothetical protein